MWLGVPIVPGLPVPPLPLWVVVLGVAGGVTAVVSILVADYMQILTGTRRMAQELL